MSTLCGGVQLAYLEVQRLVSQEAWPLFKAHMKARGPRSMELQSGGSFKGGNVSPARPLSQLGTRRPDAHSPIDFVPRSA